MQAWFWETRIWSKMLRQGPPATTGVTSEKGHLPMQIIRDLPGCTSALLTLCTWQVICSSYCLSFDIILGNVLISQLTLTWAFWLVSAVHGKGSFWLQVSGWEALVSDSFGQFWVISAGFGSFCFLVIMTMPMHVTCPPLNTWMAGGNFFDILLKALAVEKNQTICVLIIQIMLTSLMCPLPLYYPQINSEE